VRAAALWLGMCAAAAAQPVSWGFRAGVPLTEAFSAASGLRVSYLAASQRWVAGPTLELNLPFRTSISIDALYRRVRYDSTAPGEAATTSANRWEFPMLVKHRVSGGVARPYLAAGAMIHRLSNVKQVVTCIPLVTGCGGIGGNPFDLTRRTAAGVVVAGGIELRLPFLRLSPEIRYTRLGAESVRDPTGLLRTIRNQAEFIVGVTF